MIEYKVKVFESGYREWYLNDEFHREDGPAIEYADGSKNWYLNGKYHREDGPAVEHADGSKSWYLNGERFTEEGFNERMNPSPSCDGEVITHKGKKYKLTLVESE